MTNTKQHRRRNRTVSAAALYSRFRALWIDGMAFDVSAVNLEFLRDSMRRLAVDDAYWQSLAELAELKVKADKMRESLR